MPIFVVLWLEAALLCIGIKSPGNQAKEDRPKYRPKRGLIIMIQDWLQTGKDDTDRYDQPNDRRNPVGCSLRLKEHKWPIQVLDLLKEWEAPTKNRYGAEVATLDISVRIR